MAQTPVNGPLLAGYFGFGNAGDEMILDLLQRRWGPAAYLSGPRPAGGAALPRYHPLLLVQQLRRSKALVLGGGELFQSRTSLRSLAYYLALPLLARALGKPFLGFSLALDPDLGPLERWATRSVLSGAAGLWVRDELSRRSLEIAGTTLGSMPDIVWAWPVPSFAPPRSLRRILWIPRFSSLENGGLSLRAAFSPFRGGIEHGILSFHPAEDGPAIGRFRAGLSAYHRLETWSSLDDVFERISRYDLVVSMRYHGLVAAVLSGRPVVAIPGHGKVLSLAKELNVSTVDPSTLSGVPWDRVFDAAFRAGAPSPGDRPALAAAALADLARVYDDIPLHK